MANIKKENIPKELEGLTSPEKFTAFLKSASVRVSEMSDGESKVYVSQKALGGGGKKDYKVDKALIITQGGTIIPCNIIRPQKWVWVEKNGNHQMNSKGEIYKHVGNRDKERKLSNEETKDFIKKHDLKKYL